MKKKKINWAEPFLNKEDEDFIVKALKSTWISGGEYVEKFESQTAEYINSKFSISVNNGTSAIHLVYLSLGLKPGDEIIIPGYGYLAAANIALQMGLKPIFADVDVDSFCISAKTIKKKITKKTKLIVIINTYGNIFEINEINKLGKEYGILILEDAAESFGSKYFNKLSGSLTDISTFSFQATKVLTTGEGGMVSTKLGKDFQDKLKMWRNHGIKDKRYFHYLPGSNFRLTNLQASMGCSQLKKINKVLKKRNKLYSYYKLRLRGIEGIRLQLFHKDTVPVVWTLAVVLSKSIFKNRDLIINELYKKGIETRNGFYSPDNLSIFSNCDVSSLKNSSWLSKQVLCLPLHYNLSEDDIDFILSELINCKR